MTNLRSRILVAEFDSVATRRLYDDFGQSTAEVESHLIGALRIAHLIGGEILLTDSMLFDSRFFTEVTPSDLAAAIGSVTHRLPLTVLHDEPTLADALDAKRAKGHGFRWQLAGRDAGHDWAGPDIRAAWASWVRASGRGQLQSEPLRSWPDGSPKEPFDLDMDLSTEWSDPGIATLVAAARAGNRSAVFDAYDAALASGPDDDLRNELNRLRGLYNTAYFDAMARQHAADWVSFTGYGDVVAQTPGRTTLRVSGSLVETAAVAPPAIFSQIVFATTDERAAFLQTRKRRHLLALAYRANVATSSSDLWGTLRSTMRSAVLALLAVLIAVPGMSEAAGWLPWTTFGVAVLLAVPWDAISTANGLRPSRLDATLSLRTPQ